MKIKDFKVKRKRTVHVSFGPIRKIKKAYTYKEVGAFFSHLLISRRKKYWR